MESRPLPQRPSGKEDTEGYLVPETKDTNKYRPVSDDYVDSNALEAVYESEPSINNQYLRPKGNDAGPSRTDSLGYLTPQGQQMTQRAKVSSVLINLLCSGLSFIFSEIDGRKKTKLCNKTL